jgi:carboxypeptidase PM20D1
MMKTISPYLSLKNRLAVKHEKLFGKQILRKLSKDPFTNSLIRTVITPTLIHGGIKENVLPVSAVANLNIRIMPGDSIESVMNYQSGRINDERVKINMKAPFYNPSLVSSTDTKAWELLAELISSVFPGVAVAPFLFPATTDSHHYTGLSKNIYRFIPLKLNPEDREKIHGVGERIGIADYLQSIQFYSRLFQRL